MKKVFVLLGCAAAVCFSGCRSGNNGLTREQADQMLKTLDQLTKEIAALKTEVKTIRPAVSSSGSFRENKRVFTVKPLPKNPTDQDITQYISEIQMKSAGQNSFSTNDFQVDLYRKIGKGHLKLLLNSLRSGSGQYQYHLQYALPDLVSKEDKKLVIDNLVRVPGLVQAVTENGWLKDAKENIFLALEHSGNIWELKSAIGSLAETAEDYKRIANCFINNSRAESLYSILKQIPKIDLAEVTSKAWERQRYSDQWSKDRYAVYAALNGNKDALEYLAKVALFPERRNSIGSDLLMELLILTGQPLDKLGKWYEENSKNLVFNKEKKRFEVKVKE